MAEPTKVSIDVYRPSEDTRKARERVYKDIDKMLEVRNQTYKQFNGGQSSSDRTLKQYIDDSNRRLNGYTLTRQEQDKEDWQANFFDNITRSKMKAFIAGVAMNIPDLAFKAVNAKGVFSAKRAEAMKQLVKHSRVVNSNPVMEVFWETWEACGQGTVVKYDGWLKTKEKIRFVKNYDPITGKVEEEEKEEITNDKAIELIVPLSEFFIRDFHIEDIQDQLSVAWIQHYSKAQLEKEFRNYPNHKYLTDAQLAQRYTGETDTYFYNAWKSRVQNENDYEVIRWYSKEHDAYEIWINGVDLLQAPLVWGRKRKLYPFAKTILEPFESRKFFYGKSFPHIMEGIQDVRNTLKNSILDKLYRSFAPVMLVGLVNKDILDIEEELINQDNKIYVPDVSQVKPMPFEGLTQGDIAMIEINSRDADLAASVDTFQQGVQGKGVTAREIMLADENARKLKGVFFAFIEDLWLQKTRIRIPNILVNYMQKRVQDIGGEADFPIYNVPNTELSDGSIGTLGIHVADSKTDMMPVPKIEARENVMAEQGINYKLISITSDYFDNWEFDFVVVPDTLYAKDAVKRQAEFDDKLQKMITVFPEYVASNKEKLFQKFLELNGESIQEYNPPAQPPAPEAPLGNESLLGLTQNNAPASA